MHPGGGGEGLEVAVDDEHHLVQALDRRQPPQALRRRVVGQELGVQEAVAVAAVSPWQVEFELGLDAVAALREAQDVEGRVVREGHVLEREKKMHRFVARWLPK